ncbi:MAG: hypothetical protein LC640_11860, partial [Frankia sp.]|nr:hypothetical protein [Frankia sp.]
HALLGVVVALSPALVISFSRDLTEPLAWLCLLAGLYWWRDRRLMLGAVAFALAALTRETSLVVVAGVGADELFRRDAVASARARALAWLAVPLAAFATWQAWLYGVWHALPVRSNDGNVGAPFVDVVHSAFLGATRWGDWSHDAVIVHLALVERLALAAFFGYVVMSLARTRAEPGVRIAWVLAALLTLSIRGWLRDEQFVRAANEAICVGLLIVFARPLADRSVRWVAGAAAALSLVVAVKFALL